MGFTYTYGANPTIDYPRLLIADTVETTGSPAVRAYIFDDQEILSVYQIQQLGSFQSSQFYSGLGQGATVQPPPTSYFRVAAILLQSIASNRSRLGSLVQVLDVKLDPTRAAKMLRDQAKAYLEMDDNSGAIVIIEQCRDQWSTRQRFWFEVMRQQGLGFN